MAYPRAKKGSKNSRAPEPHEMTAAELRASLEAITGLPMPDHEHKQDYLRWHTLTLLQILIDAGMELEAALRLAELELLSEHKGSADDDIRTVFAEIAQRPVEENDWIEAQSFVERWNIEHEWLFALS